jgi:2-methylcitrate dehydratase
MVLADGRTVVEELAVADAHPLGARPFERADYVAKFRSLADGVLEPAETERFLHLAERLPELSSTELGDLTLIARPGLIDADPRTNGIF